MQKPCQKNHSGVFDGNDSVLQKERDLAALGPHHHGAKKGMLRLCRASREGSYFVIIQYSLSLLRNSVIPSFRHVFSRNPLSRVSSQSARQLTQ